MAKGQPLKSGRNGTARWRTLLSAAALMAMGLGTARGADNNIIGGNAIIPINPKFSPDTQLYLPQNVKPRDGGVDFLTNPVAQLLGLNQALQVQISVPVTLGAALSQAISAGNRPSVLTPYGGILKGEGANAKYDTFGSLVTNKATTIGKGKFGLGLSYQHSEFDAFDGRDIGTSVNTDSVQKTNLNVDQGGFQSTTVVPFTTKTSLRVKDVEFKADVVTLALTYGLLENVDVGALIPYIWLNTSGKVDMKVTQFTQVNTKNPSIPLDVTFPKVGSVRHFRGSWDRDFDGIGDIILFTKWQILSQDGLPKRIKSAIDLALELEVKLPTGDEDKFLGTDKTDVAMRILAQRHMTDRLILRGEVGYNRSGLGNEFNTYEYKVGTEFQISDNLAASAELIGSYSEEFHGIIDVAGGLKYGVSRDFKVFAGVRAPLNDNGLRYPWSPILGVEYTFSPAPKADMNGLQAPGKNPTSPAPASAGSAAPRPAQTNAPGVVPVPSAAPAPGVAPVPPAANVQGTPGAGISLLPTQSKAVTVTAPPPAGAVKPAAAVPAAGVGAAAPAPAPMQLPRGVNR